MTYRAINYLSLSGIFLLLFFSTNVRADGFNSVYSKDGMDVIAAGNNGNFFRSWDGGNTWGTYPIGTSNLNSVFVINYNIWLAADNGTIIRSSNDGNNWSEILITPNKNLRSIFFNDLNNGWVTGDSGFVAVTTNSGINWEYQQIDPSIRLNSIKFINSQKGYACGTNGKAYITTNSGTNWNSLNTNVNNSLLNIDAIGNTVIISGEDGFVLHSTNSGINWTNIDYNILSRSKITDVQIIDSLNYFTCGGGGFIRKNTSTNVIYQSNPMIGDLVSIHFSNQLTGFGVSSKNNAVIRTTNGGLNWLLPTGTNITYQWQQKQSGSGNIGNGFETHPTNKDGLFIMMGNNIYRSLNRGENWTLIGSCTIGGSAHSFYVNDVDTNIMLCSKGSSGGYVCRSTNYGQTWSIVWGPGNLTSYGMPLETDPNNPDIAYLGPDNSSFLKSTNFGLNWSVISNRTFRSPCDVYVSYHNPNIIYIGDGTTGSGNGEFFKSSDGGINWTSIHTVSGSEIPMIAMSSIDSNVSYHSTWSSGGLWRSIDQWSTFQQLNTLSNLWACDIAKDDPTAVAFANYGSTGYLSVNSGINYANSTIGSSPGAGMYYYDKGTLLVQQGGGVYKLNISYNVITSNNTISSVIPKEYKLYQNFPNPFNPSTTIKFQIPGNLSSNNKDAIVMNIYNSIGQKIKTLINSYMSPGEYDISFNAANYPSGIYFYSLQINGKVIDTKKMILIK